MTSPTQLISPLNNLSTSSESTTLKPSTPYPFSSSTSNPDQSHQLTVKNLSKQNDLYASPTDLHPIEQGSTAADIDIEINHPVPPLPLDNENANANANADAGTGAGKLIGAESKVRTLSQKKRKYSADLYDFHHEVYQEMKSIALRVFPNGSELNSTHTST